MFERLSTLLAALALPGSVVATEKQSVVIMAPPAGVFAAYVVATDAPDKIRATFANEREFETVTGIARGGKVTFLVGVTNCKANPAGDCQLRIAISSRKPDGSAWGQSGEVAFVAKASDAADKWTLWEGSIDASFDVGEPAGDYTTTFVVTDDIAEQARTVSQTINATDKAK